MRKLTYEQVIENSISHLNKNYTEGQLGFTEKIHLSEEITALVSGLVDSINECIEGPEKEISFAGKLVRFHQEQEYRSGIKVRYCFSTDGDYKCTVDDGDNVGVEFSETQKTYMFSKNDVYLSEEK